MKLAIKITSNGQVWRMFPSHEVRLPNEPDTAFFSRIAAKDCPAGATWEVVADSAFPSLPQPQPIVPTLSQLEAQLASIAAQIAALKNSA